MSEEYDNQILFETEELSRDLGWKRLKAIRQGRTRYEILDRLRYERAKGIGKDPKEWIHEILQLGRWAGMTETALLAYVREDIAPGIRQLEEMNKAQRGLLKRRLERHPEVTGEEYEPPAPVSLADAWDALLKG